MKGFDLYVFFLCLIVFTALTTLFTFFTVWIVKLLIRILRAGLEDENIKKEYAKREKRGGKDASGLLDKIVSSVFCAIFILFFIFSTAVNITSQKMVGDIPVLRVVQSASMSKKYEKNDWLFKNNLNDQFQTFDLILTEKLPDEMDLKLYDIVVYEVDDTLIVHRIIKIEEANSKHPDCRWFTLQGDNVQYPDKTPVLYSQMRAIYRGTRIPYIGSFVSFMQSPAGALCILLIIFGSIAIPIVEKIIEREKLKRLRLMLRREQKLLEKQKAAAAEVLLVETAKEKPAVKPTPKPVEQKPVQTPVTRIPAPKVVEPPKEFRIKISADELPEGLYDGGYERNTYDWFYDSLNDTERTELINLFIYKELPRSYLLPEFVIRGDNFEFFRIFFENVEIFAKNVSPNLLLKMRLYCINNYCAKKIEE